jgi:hypothetical protein
MVQWQYRLNNLTSLEVAGVGIKLKCSLFIVVLKVLNCNGSDGFVIAFTNACVLGFMLSSVAALTGI